MKNWLSIGLITLLFNCPSYAEQLVVDERQQLYKKIEDDSELLEYFVDDADWIKTAELANRLAKDVLKLKQLFPEHSKGDGRSKTKIWANWHDFENKLDNWSLLYLQVENASKIRDINKLEHAVDTANSTCRSCHMKYRSLW